MGQYKEYLQKNPPKSHSVVMPKSRYDSMESQNMFNGIMPRSAVPYQKSTEKIKVTVNTPENFELLKNKEKEYLAKNPEPATAPADSGARFRKLLPQVYKPKSKAAPEPATAPADSGARFSKLLKLFKAKSKTAPAAAPAAA